MLKEDEFFLSDEQRVIFTQGCYVLANTVPSTILSVILEPDFGAKANRKMTLYSMGLVTADEQGQLPIYRFCHDLVDGSIPLEDEYKSPNIKE
jgi:hypothetical protein